MTTLRPAEPRDAAAAAAVMRASIRRLCAADHGDDPNRVAAWCANKTAAHFRRWLASPGTRLFVAELDGRIAAVGSVSTGGEVLLNYVAPRAALPRRRQRLLARLEAEQLRRPRPRRRPAREHHHRAPLLPRPRLDRRRSAGDAARHDGMAHAQAAPPAVEIPADPD